jgi:hypothetical protein
MDPYLMQVFLVEIDKQCEFALRAMALLRTCLYETWETDGVFFSVQAFLCAAGNVSKLLWSNSSEIPGRGKILRELLGVSEDSAVAPRTFRNHFEHFDERLEKWAVTSQHRNFVDSNILSSGAIAGVAHEDRLRNLEPTTLALSFRGDTYDLPTVEAALKEIQDAARAKLH